MVVMHYIDIYYNITLLSLLHYYSDVYCNFKGQLKRVKSRLQTLLLSVMIESNLFSEPQLYLASDMENQHALKLNASTKWNCSNILI